jgi:hypothetical protein
MIMEEISYTPAKMKFTAQNFLCNFASFIFLKRSRFDSRRGLGIFLLDIESRTALGSTQPPIQWVLDALSLRVKRPGREPYHSPPSGAEVKRMRRVIPPLPNTS